MLYCPHCKSHNIQEVPNLPPSYINQQNQTYTNYNPSYNDNFVEFVCCDCGIVTKIDPRIYKSQDEEE